MSVQQVCFAVIAADKVREARLLAGWCKILERSESSVASSES